MPRYVHTPYEPAFTGTILQLMQRPAQARAEAARRSGDIAAQASLQRGQAWGNAIGSIGQIASGAMQQYGQEQEQERRQQALAQAVQGVIRGEVGPDALLAADPENGPKVLNGLKAYAELSTGRVKNAQETAGRLALGLKALPQAQRAQLWPQVRQAAIQGGLGDEQSLPADPNDQFLDAVIAWGTGKGPEQPKAPEAFTLSPGETRFGPDGKPIANVPKPVEPPPPPKPVYRMGADKRTLEQVGEIPANATMVQEPQPPRVTVNAGAGGDTAPKDIADAIIRGDQPPTLQGLYRYGAPVRAELARKGYDLTKAMTDWNATQRHFATLNGPQQTRIRQAAETAYHSLDVIEDLTKQWKGGRFPALNAANLVAAKGGAYGADAQKVATLLEAQITDVASELANVYMGGNSPTDHALKMAAKNLNANWSQEQLLAALNLSRKNLQIRLNSIRNTGVIGASENNPYAPTPAPTGQKTKIGRFEVEIR